MNWRASGSNAASDPRGSNGRVRASRSVSSPSVAKPSAVTSREPSASVPGTSHAAASPTLPSGVVTKEGNDSPANVQGVPTLTTTAELSSDSESTPKAQLSPQKKPVGRDSGSGSLLTRGSRGAISIPKSRTEFIAKISSGTGWFGGRGAQTRRAHVGAQPEGTLVADRAAVVSEQNLDAVRAFTSDGSLRLSLDSKQETQTSGGGAQRLSTAGRYSAVSRSDKPGGVPIAPQNTSSTDPQRLRPASMSMSSSIDSAVLTRSTPDRSMPAVNVGSSGLLRPSIATASSAPAFPGGVGGGPATEKVEARGFASSSGSSRRESDETYRAAPSTRDSMSNFSAPGGANTALQRMPSRLFTVAPDSLAMSIAADAQMFAQRRPSEMSDVSDESVTRSVSSVQKQPKAPHSFLPVCKEPVDNVFNDLIVHSGTTLRHRYAIGKVLGSGSFGQVVRAYDLVTKKYMAIKIIRSGSLYYKLAAAEASLLSFLNRRDPNDEACMLRLYDHFVYQGHQCLVMELLSFSLYDLLRSTDFYGVSLRLVKRFASQILTCLSFLLKQNVIHSDLKPENVLLRHAQRPEIKVVDFGSSVSSAGELAAYIQSRFYRAPEVLMNYMPYSSAVDLWSVGCLMVELHVGYAIFPGQNEKDQVALIVEKLGMPPAEILERSNKAQQYFLRDSSGQWSLLPNLAARENGDVVPKSLPLRHFVEQMSEGVEERRRQSSWEDLENFYDLIERMLEFDPAKRISADAALKHPFFTTASKSNEDNDMAPVHLPTRRRFGRERARESGREAPLQKQRDVMDDPSSGGRDDALSAAGAELAADNSLVSNPRVRAKWKREVGIETPPWSTMIPRPLFQDPTRPGAAQSSRSRGISFTQLAETRVPVPPLTRTRTRDLSPRPRGVNPRSSRRTERYTQPRGHGKFRVLRAQ